MEERYIDISVDDLLEVTLAKDDDFLKVKETLTRIGVSSRKENKLYQSCHILHKRGKYYIVHFKELFALDGRNTITNLLAEWELLKIVDSEQSEEPLTPINKIKILPYREKGDWELCPKYHIGKKK